SPGRILYTARIRVKSWKWTFGQPLDPATNDNAMSKNKDRKRVDAKQSLAKAPLDQEVERLIQKGRLKDAVKQAKMCYHEESTPAHHRLLERAYFLRAQQLHREAMPTAAAEVAQHLLDFGVTDPDLPAELVPLLL